MLPMSYGLSSMPSSAKWSTPLSGIFMKQIGAFYGPILFWVIIAGFLFAVHVVLQAYVLVTYLPGLKPVTYTGILHAANLAMNGTHE